MVTVSVEVLTSRMQLKTLKNYDELESWWVIQYYYLIGDPVDHTLGEVKRGQLHRKLAPAIPTKNEK